MTKHTAHSNQAGFTIIELLIATLVFAVVLIIITSGIIQFSKQYYKGVISTNTQVAARSLIEDISRSIQYNGGYNQLPSNPPNTSKGYCVGSDRRYSYLLNQQITNTSPLGANQSNHALISDTIATPCSTSVTPVNVATIPVTFTTLTTPRELIPPHTRLSKFSITQDLKGNLYAITVKLIYGDNDLLCSPAAGDCNAPGTSSSVFSNPADLSCKASAGSQFCAVSELSTTINQRVN